MILKKTVNKMLVKHRYLGVKRNFGSLYEKILKQGGLDKSNLQTNDGINKWKSKWCKYDNKLSPLSYMIFSQYIGEDVNIIPLEVLAGIVEPVLTPEVYRGQYNDKNNFSLLFKGLRMPQTLARNINGVCYDNEYNPVDNPLFFMKSFDNPEIIVLKPSREQGGKGVKMFELKDKRYVSSTGEVLTTDYIKTNYKNNWLIQKAVQQNEYLTQFNPTSVNTIRIATYRSVKTGEIHIINAMMRIGARGKNVDNVHSGGMRIGINKNDGTLGKYVCDWLGHTEDTFNGIDFANGNYYIPHWEVICRFAKQVSENILFGNLVALDVALDMEGQPVLIEVNVGGFSGGAFQFINGSVFGDFTDEIMEYCWPRYKSLTSAISLQ